MNRASPAAKVFRLPQLAALAALTPLAADAAPASQGNAGIQALMLPVLLALAIGLHALIARAAKTVLSAARPLASGEAEACGYDRRVYHTAAPAMLAVVATALGAGALLWLGYVTGAGGWWAAGLLALFGAVALDLWSWERVTASASFLWFRRGSSGQVHQILIENIQHVTVDERDERRWPTLRHGYSNRVCRLRLLMRDKHVVGLPKTDANCALDDVEAVANFVRARQQQSAQRVAIDAAEQRAAVAATEAAATPAQARAEAEMRLALRRLRQKALAPEAPPAVPSQDKRQGPVRQ